MKYILPLAIAAAMAAAGLVAQTSTPDPALFVQQGDGQSGLGGRYAGSASCRECHESFYELWAPSHHGRAMQLYTPEFAQANLTAPNGPIKIGAHEYLACVGPEEGWILERGPQARDLSPVAQPSLSSPLLDKEGWVTSHESRLPILHVLGGKNVYYFLTPLERGRLQTLPLAYDVRTKQWFDTAASGVRHFPHAGPDTPVHWTDSMYTFNTSCHGCHVSQLSTNYDLKTDTYRTTWAEPGINCEACHGPAQEHVRVCRTKGVSSVKLEVSSDASALQTSNLKLQTPFDLKIIRTKPFNAEQMNSLCASCHAKMSPVSPSFTPGERYFDHFDLTTLEHPDFYPDGRDLGENYTMTSWHMSPCVKSGKLDCMHCHTSSGRYRFRPAEGVMRRAEETHDAQRLTHDEANAACLPCHQARVENAPAHTHHAAGSAGNRCVSCHMPMTEFARMTRSDHSMLPPTPAATLQFQSPNACNLCHTDKDAAWADQQVRQWRKRDYQQPVLERAALVGAARRGDWSRLSDILAYIGSKDRDEIVAASLLRLLYRCESPAKWPAVLKALREDPSPLVRAAAAQALEGHATEESLQALGKAAGDAYRLVRVRAAGALAGIPAERFPGEHRATVARAAEELLEALGARPDDYASQYNLGNFHLQRGEQAKALASYEHAIKLRPDFVPPHVNIAFVHNARGHNDQAEASFRRALALEPNSPVIHLNLAMLLGEMNRPQEAQQAFRRTLELDPNSAVAAYNLGVMLAADRPYESLRWCQKAYQLRPDEGKYGYTYAFYLHQRRETEEAVKVLREMIRRNVPSGDAYALLGEIHLRRGQVNEAASVYRAAYANRSLAPSERESFRTMLRRLEQGF
ncbi:MAG: ammonia-forming cytochrome c nitrite reductase subunit c552 [Planctomycetes bacterium]|nr:ammonia-forming cytochrome c nitrite reductase subunit c552 [Planctomycetota bacterium]